MRKLILFLIISLFSIGTVYADIFKIPFSCYPQKIQEEFLKQGYILDLETDGRSNIAFGFIRNQGQEYEIITYREATETEMQMILNITLEIEKWRSQR